MRLNSNNNNNSLCECRQHCNNMGKSINLIYKFSPWICCKTRI